MAPSTNLPGLRHLRASLFNDVTLEREYVKLDFPSEDIEEYREGGFHPIRAGSIFRGRYFIKGKIGYGGCGTVWWATDTVQERQVALKAHASEKLNPMQTFYYHDEDLAPEHPGHNSIVKLIRMFWHRGPNGNHLCLVLELAGPKIESYMKYRSTGGFTVSEIQKIALNVANALAYLHAERYVHGDYTPNNVFVKIKDPREWIAAQYEVVDQLRKSVNSELLVRVDGDLTQPHGPRKITSPMQLWRLDAECLTTDIIVGDLDASFPYEDSPERNFILPPLHYCAPELLTQLIPTPPNQQTDVWCLGLTLFMIRSGNLLIPRTKYIGKMFLSLHVRLGDSPKLQELWTTRDEYLDGDGKPMIYPPAERSLREMIDDIGRNFEESAGTETETVTTTEDTASSIVTHKTSVTEWVPPAPSPAEVECFHDLMGKMLEVDPAKRIKADEVVNHPWFVTEFEG